MIEIESQVKKWGNSLGIVIPKEIAKRIDLKPTIRIRLIIERPEATKVKDIFGKLKIRESTDKLLKQTDEAFDIGF